MDWMPMAVRDGIIVVLIISGPLVLAAAFIGLVVGILQAATQVQEQTIGSALKIIGVFGLMIATGFWMFQYLNQYTSRTLSTAFTFVPRRTQKVIPSDLYKKDAKEQARGGFQEQLQAEVLQLPSKIEPLEPIGGVSSESGVIPGAPFLGALEAPKPPPIVDKVPELPAQPAKPKLPNFQEPKLPSVVDKVPELPAQPGNPKLPNLQEPKLLPDLKQLQDSKPIDNKIPLLEDERLELDKEKLNLLPGVPIDGNNINNELVEEEANEESITWIE